MVAAGRENIPEGPRNVPVVINQNPEPELEPNELSRFDLTTGNPLTEEQQLGQMNHVFAAFDQQADYTNNPRGQFLLERIREISDLHYILNPGYPSHVAPFVGFSRDLQNPDRIKIYGKYQEIEQGHNGQICHDHIYVQTVPSYEQGHIDPHVRCIRSDMNVDLRRETLHVEFTHNIGA
jgi:hypothetical protein